MRWRAKVIPSAILSFIRIELLRNLAIIRNYSIMKLKEEQELQEAAVRGDDTSAAKVALEKTVRPALPEHVTLQELHQRLNPSQTVILTCGNPSSMADIKYAADMNQIRFEKEDW